ncbi:MAG: MFS transporter [Ammonifex sp.]|nr:MAG: MFS transporter [Ammonifex sp.]
MRCMKKIDIWVLAGVPLVMVLGNSMLIPILPAMKSYFGISVFQAGLIITLFSVPAGLTIPFTGLLADRLGRRMVLIPALGLYALSGLAAGLSYLILQKGAYPYILLSRVFQGIGAAGTAPIAMALVGDLVGGKQRSHALGVLEAANGTGKIISPILGAAVGLLGWFYPFFVFPIFVIPILIGILFLVNEPKTRSEPTPFGEYWKILKAALAQKGCSLASAFFAGMTSLLLLFGLLFFLSEHLETALKVGGVYKGLLLAVPVAFMSLTAYITGLIIKKRVNFMPFVVAGGLFVLGAALASFVFFHSTFFFFTGISLAGVGVGLALPCLNTLVTSSVGITARGIVTAFYGGVRFLGVAAGPPLFAFLLVSSFKLTFGAAAGLAVLAAILTLVFVRGSVMTSSLEVQKSQGKQRK